MVLKDENGNELNYTLGQYEGDSTFLKVMKINILQGLSEREALKQYSTPVYINEQYARLLVPKGENPVGKPVRLYDTEFGKMEKEGEPNSDYSRDRGESIYRNLTTRGLP